ncbi:MAG: hypothetical protein HC941_30210 [Microcoleus sp. SU_5_3]|nr:hypothetical protein [Microcoleus sp. SU_5_3]
MAGELTSKLNHKLEVSATVDVLLEGANSPERNTPERSNFLTGVETQKEFDLSGKLLAKLLHS